MTPEPIRKLVRRHIYRQPTPAEREDQLARIIATVTTASAGSVAQGAFEGMRWLTDRPAWDWCVPHLIGSYESELSPDLEEIIATKPSMVIDVGCAEGWYAVGLALRLPEAVIHAFDIDPQARRNCADLARLNNVAAQVVIDEECTSELLRALVRPGALIIVDCEGCELGLLQPEVITHLKDVAVIVELHDFIDPETSRTLLARFEPTHVGHLVTTGPKKLNDWHLLRSLPRADRRAAVDEHRPAHPGPMQWAVFRPKPTLS